MDSDPVLSTLSDFLHTVAADDRMAVALSGGGDSVALALGLVRVGAGPRVVCLYVDHQDRTPAEMDAEWDFVRGFGERWGLEVRRLVAPVSPREGNFEARARRLRYQALLAEAATLGCGLLLTAHTLDDQLETLLIRLFRGNSFGGLRGIPPARGPIRRPLLGLRRAQLRDWLLAQGQDFFQDSSNQGPNLRARVRRELVPRLDALFPAWRGAFQEAVRRLVPTTDWPWEEAKGGVEMEVEAWRRLTRRQRVEALLAAYRGQRPVSRRHLFQVVGREGDFTGGSWVGTVRGGRVSWGPAPPVVNPAEFRYFLRVHAGGRVSFGGRTLRTESLEGCPNELYIVHPEEGDRWRTPEGAPSLSTVRKRCAPRGGMSTWHLLVSGLTVYGLIASPCGGGDWAYTRGDRAIWHWEDNERFE